MVDKESVGGEGHSVRFGNVSFGVGLGWTDSGWMMRDRWTDEGWIDVGWMDNRCMCGA